MKELQNQIKNNEIGNLYLFYGPEGYLKDFYISQIKKLVVPNDDDTFNYLKMTTDIDYNALTSFIYSMPVFNDRKILVIKNSNIFKNVKEGIEEKWLDIFGNIQKDVVIIFSENEVDKRKSLYKKITSLGKSIAFEYMKEAELKNWVKSLIVKQKITMSDECIDLFLSLCPSDMNTIFNELKKLMFFKKDERVITKEDINISVCKSIENRVFDMVDCATKGKTKEALDMYYDLLVLNEPLERILANISAEYLKIRKTKLLLNENADRSEIASEIKVPPYFAGGYIEKCKKMSIEKINEMIYLCQESDYFLKNGIKERAQIIENIIIQSQI